ncbi:MAG: type II toxin-antitoxin system prevent-host-death family antitoxin [Halothiobacillaceae bacterium]|nr:type II toxin-antitoxin system prevent-host-death family antitoxin [Halothiobacillaceae bacterium]
MQVNIHEAKSQLSKLIQRTLDGEEVIIARNNQPIVRLQRIDKPRRKRQLGALRGLVQATSPDFNAPLEDMTDYIQ